MIQMPEIVLAQSAIDYLSEKQLWIDDIDSYADRVKKGQALWKSKSSTSKDYEIIKATLSRMCVGKKKCNYCEDSAADEVEHIQPKSIYPDLTFVWANYLYALGPLNGLKNDAYAVLDTMVYWLRFQGRKTTRLFLLLWGLQHLLIQGMKIPCALSS
jgi:hypothetical protein